MYGKPPTTEEGSHRFRQYAAECGRIYFCRRDRFLLAARDPGSIRPATMPLHHTRPGLSRGARGEHFQQRSVLAQYSPAGENRSRVEQTPAAGNTPPFTYSYQSEEFIPVKCNIHPWMQAYFVVLKTSHFAVTGENGQFALPDLPAGAYTITAWHETYGTQSQEVTIGEGQRQTVNFTFQANSLKI